MKTLINFLLIFSFLIPTVVAQEQHTYSSKEDVYQNWIKKDGETAYAWGTPDHNIGILLQTYWYEIRSINCWKWTYDEIPTEATVLSVIIKFKAHKSENHNLKFSVHNIPYIMESTPNTINYFDQCNTNQVFESAIIQPDINNNIYFSQEFTEQNGFEVWNAVNSAIKSGSYFLTLGIREKENLQIPYWSISSYDNSSNSLHPAIDLIVNFTTPNNYYTLINKIQSTENYDSLILNNDITHPKPSGGSPVFLPWGSQNTVRTAVLPFIVNWNNTGTTQKHNYWYLESENNDYSVHHNFQAISTSPTVLKATFLPTANSILKNNLIENVAINAGNISFIDPWFYYKDAYNNWLQSNLYKNYLSPLSIQNNSSTSYGGVFLNQGYPNWQPPYYSVKVDEVQSIDLGGTIGTRDFYFQNWSANPPGSAEFQNAYALETPVVFKSDGTTVQANLKGHLFTNSLTATAPNNQRKIVQGSNGYWAMVYVSMNQVWLSRSTDGVNWEREILISDWDTGINGYPSIDIYSDLAYVVWQNIYWFGISGWNTCFINVRRFDLTNNTLGPTITAASFEPPNESFISTPVIAYPGGKSNEIVLAWRETDGIKIIHGDSQLGDDNITWGNVFAIPGTNSYSSNPSIAFASGYNFALCWSHNYSGNKIYYSTASKTYNPEWTFSNAAIISPSYWESNINPQITVINSYRPTIVWTSRNNIVEGRSSVHICQRSGLGTSDTWGNITTYSPPTSENLSPVIGDYYGLNKMEVLWNIGNTVYKASYNGTSWVGPTTLTTSGGSGVNINRTTAYQTKALWKKSDNTVAFYNVGGTAPPSKIVASSEDKETTLPYRLNRHAIIELPKDIDSTAKGSVCFEIAGISTLYNNSETKINYSLNENNLLASEPFRIAAADIQLNFSGAIYGAGLELQNNFISLINEPLAKVMLKDSKTNETLQNLWVNNSAMLDQVQNKTFGEFRNVSVDLNKYLGKSVYVQVEMIGKSKNIAPLIVDDYLILSDSSSIANSVAKKNLAVYNLPSDYTLMQNYPNPFNPVTTISFFIPQNDYVTLKIYNTLGEEVMTAINENLEQGYHSVNINMSKEPSGVYLYSISAGSFRDTKKLMLLK